MPIKVILNYIVMAIILAILFFLYIFALIPTKEKSFEYLAPYSFALILFFINLLYSARDFKNLSSFIRDGVIERLNDISRELFKDEYLKRKIFLEIKSLKVIKTAGNKKDIK